MKKKGWVVKSISKEGCIGIVERNCDGKPEERSISWDVIKPKRISSHQKLGINDTLIEKNGFYYKPKNKKLIVLVLTLMAALSIGGFYLLNQKEDTPFNRYVEKIETKDNTNEDISQTRVRFNTTISVKKNTLQNINLENVNKGKDLQLKIKFKGDYVFDSGLIKFGNKLNSDVLSKEMPKGEHKVTAEVYSFDLEGTKTNQTNVNIKLIVE